MKNIIATLVTALVLINVPTNSFAQDNTPKTDYWQILSLVMMQRTFDTDLGMDIEKPRFSKKVKALSGETIIIEGYILPLNASRDQKYFILSAVPYNQCFFCGGAGPESVMEVFSNQPVKASKTKVKLKGKLRVNLTPTVGQVLYTLTDAQVID